MRRFKVHPYGTAARPTRLLSLLLVIAVLWMLYGRMRDPATWRVLLDANDDAAVAAQPSEPAPIPTPAAETVVAGPNDLNETEVAEAQEMFQLVGDRTTLKPREMHAYWRLMTWSRTVPFAELQQRALHDVPFTQLWEQPERYRGKPISLRLHVRRVLKYDAPANPQKLPQTYEAWGWTDESRSFPYVVVFPECPDGLPVGTDVRGEVEFVGYFLKVMSYTAFDTARGSPLLVGRVQVPAELSKPAPARTDPSLILWVMVIGIAATGIFVWMQFRSRRVVRNRSLPTDSEVDGSLAFPIKNSRGGRRVIVDEDFVPEPSVELENIGSECRAVP